LPAQAGDAALIFDPDDHDAIADVLYRIWTDEELRRVLIQKGNDNVARFSWERTARMFRAHYSRIAGQRLNEEDSALLQAPPLL